MHRSLLGPLSATCVLVVLIACGEGDLVGMPTSAVVTPSTAGGQASPASVVEPMPTTEVKPTVAPTAVPSPTETPTPTPPPEPEVVAPSFGTGEETTILVVPNPVPPGGTVTVDWTAPKGHSSSDWIASYEVGASERSYGEWYSTDSSTEGRMAFTAPDDPGEYEVRYLIDGGYEAGATQSYVVAYPEADSDAYAVVVSPEDVAPEEAIAVTWAAPDYHSAYDAIALFRIGASDDDYLEFQYIDSGNDGGVTFAAPTDLGEYELRYLINGVSTAATSNVVTSAHPWCGDVYELTAAPESVLPGEVLTANWTAPRPQSEDAWIGLYRVGRANRARFSFEYTGGAYCGTVAFDAPSVPGQYELRYLPDGRYAHAATGNTVTAQAAAFVANVPWIADGVDEEEETAYRVTLDLEGLDAAIGAAVTALPWFTDGVELDEREVIRQMLKLAEASPAAASAVIGMPWFTDGVGQDEDFVVFRLSVFAVHDADLATSMAQLPWLTDGLTQTEKDGVTALSRMAGEDVRVAKTVAGLPWFADGLSQHETDGIDNLNQLARRNPEIAGLVAGAGWFVDGMTEEKSSLISRVSGLVLEDYALASELVASPWFVESMTDSQLSSIQQLDLLRAKDAALADAVQDLPWVVAGNTDEHLTALVLLNSLADRDPALAGTVADTPWFGDSVTSQKVAAISMLNFVAERDAALAARVADMPFFTGSFEEHDAYALFTLYFLLRTGRNQDLALLKGQDWFVDGLTDEEAVYVSALRAQADFAPHEFRSLVANRFSETTTVALALAGEVRLTAMALTADAPVSVALQHLEQAAVLVEDFMGIALPAEDVTVLLASAGPPDTRRLGANFATHIVIDAGRTGDDTDLAGVIGHEVAHYYWGVDFWEGRTVGPPWFIEGGADLLGDYVLEQRFGLTLADRREELKSDDLADCAERGVTVIEQLIDPSLSYNQQERTRNFFCNYLLGEYLLLRLYESLGSEAFKDAWRDLYRLTRSDDHRGRPLAEREIYHAFLAHTPADGVEAFETLYADIHGDDFLR